MTPKGFWSYARGDDEHLDSVLSKLRNRIAGEISMLLGQDIGMFQDIYDIRTGDDWKEKLRAELTDASFMVPVLTPRYFTRPWCREEVVTYLRLAEEAGRKPLLFPIYFVEDRRYERGQLCEVREAVSRFQFFDYRPLRFESDPTRLERAIHDFANDVIDRLEKAGPVRSTAPVREPDPRPARETLAAAVAEEAAHSHPTVPPPEVPILVVDPWPNRGDQTTIATAIEAAPPGGRVVVRPGTYEENLVLDKPLELIGDGSAEEVMIRAASGDVLTVSANIAEIANLMFIGVDEEGNQVAACVTKGRASFRDCVFGSRTRSAVEVKGMGTAPEFRRCRFVDSEQSGIVIRDNAWPRLEECEMTGNGWQGVAIRTGADPALRRCVMRGNKKVGLYVHENGRGSVDECEMTGNGLDGVAIRTGADPILRHCVMRENKQLGLYVLKGARGTAEDCVLRENGDMGIGIGKGGAPVVRRCMITENEKEGICIEDADSGGTFEDNDLRGNNRGAWLIAEGAEKNLTRRDNKE